MTRCVCSATTLSDAKCLAPAASWAPQSNANQREPSGPPSRSSIRLCNDPSWQPFVQAMAITKPARLQQRTRLANAAVGEAAGQVAEASSKLAARVLPDSLTQAGVAAVDAVGQLADAAAGAEDALVGATGEVAQTAGQAAGAALSAADAAVEAAGLKQAAAEAGQAMAEGASRVRDAAKQLASEAVGSADASAAHAASTMENGAKQAVPTTGTLQQR